MIAVELHGLELRGRHGVTDEERDRNQPFRYDIDFDVSNAALSDRLEDAVDYVEVAECVRQVSDARSYSLLEALASDVADAIVSRFDVSRVRVRVRKTEVQPAGLDVEWTSATVVRRR
jgi:7,8-dihydroneopterin aldolase/epimerase/oxygenase